MLRYGEGSVTFYAAPNPFLLNKICLNKNVYQFNALILDIGVIRTSCDNDRVTGKGIEKGVFGCSVWLHWGRKA